MNPRSCRFLVVDEFSTTRRILRNLLKEVGVAGIDEAEGGHDALARLRDARHDFVVADLNMPGMSGLELLRRIRADEKLRALPVLLVVAAAGKDDIAAAARLGASGYIVKPLSRATLQEKLDRIFAALGAVAA